jgi:hypothetical protein
LINLNPDISEDVYPLIFTERYKAASSSKDGERPFCISNAYLFNEWKLCSALREKGIKVGVATSVRKEHWYEREIYPENKMVYNLELTPELVELFSSEEK